MASIAMADSDETSEEQQNTWFDDISSSSAKALDTVSIFSNQMKKIRGINLRFVSLEQSIRELTFYPLTGSNTTQIHSFHITNEVSPS